MEKSYRYLSIISIFFVVIFLISNIVSAKIVDLRYFVFDAGTLLFPLSYIFGDILTEVYGYHRSRQVIWLGFFSALLMSLAFIIVGKLPPAADWPNQAAYEAILGLTPRIVAASLVAYFCGAFLNSFVLAKLKVWTRGRYLWLRTIGSTVGGELVDSLLFVLIAFVGILPPSLLVTLIISNYVFKTLVEILFTPLTYRAIAFLKQREREDFYDEQTDFNPFSN
ncbi:MAG: queuosine precursor transporter [Patescibacteria group bacterium]